MKAMKKAKKAKGKRQKAMKADAHIERAEKKEKKPLSLLTRILADIRTDGKSIEDELQTARAAVGNGAARADAQVQYFDVISNSDQSLRR